jgi:hypothetical protein
VDAAVGVAAVVVLQPQSRYPWLGVIEREELLEQVGLGDVVAASFVLCLGIDLL